ncbi:flagellar hook-basal body complex protein [Paracoccus pacificus]|uniref:Flagellar basal-body rod protein FlgF n=1 Tax=Paracoccus pacificus TaxID=1463598 RepID=A0ABW4RAB2_9RHOB
MDNAIYAGLTRQSGLMREMRVVANNIANAQTTGFRREGVVFSEYMVSLNAGGDTLSMANARGRLVDLKQGGLSQTNATFDMAIEGDGFFMVETPQGNQLTRAGSFIPSAEGELLTPDGYRVLDEGEAPIQISPEARNIAVAPDGTISANGEPIARIGMFQVADQSAILHQGGTRFSATGAAEPAENARIRQGFVEESNVDPVAEISRMIEVQRAYELGQGFLDSENERIRTAITSLTR